MGTSFCIEPEPRSTELDVIAKDIQRFVGEAVHKIEAIGTNEYKIVLLGMFCSMEVIIKRRDDAKRPWGVREPKLWIANNAFDPNEILGLFHKLARGLMPGTREGA